MRLRLELFVDDLEASERFYVDVLGFAVVRRDRGYRSLRRGITVLGLGLASMLPVDGPKPGFTQARLTVDKGPGVEIVLELDDVDEVIALYEHCRTRTAISDPLQQRPWGLSDFRLGDPDGYYLRITHGNYAIGDG